MEIDSSFLAFPAQAGTHLSTAPKSGRNTKALPRVADPRRGTMDPGLRRGGDGRGGAGIHSQTVRRGRIPRLLDPAEVKKGWDELRGRDAAGRFFAGVNAFIVSGTKGAGT
jgi:hypothetical protein